MSDDSTGNTRFRAWLLICLWLMPWTGQAQTPPSASPSPSIEGDWLVSSRDAVIRIVRIGDEYQGRIVWQLHDTYGPEDGAELNGKIVTDRNNPDPALRAQPLTGLLLLRGLHYLAADNMWVDGWVYNSDNGKTYHCNVRLLDADHLRLHGYIGVSLIGGSTTWTRVPPPPAPSPRSG